MQIFLFRYTIYKYVGAFKSYQYVFSKFTFYIEQYIVIFREIFSSNCLFFFKVKIAS